jgi:hypothetical protein
LRRPWPIPGTPPELAVHVDEEAGVELWGLATVTDTFTRALAEVDLSTLPEPYQEVLEAVQELVAVAQHAVAHQHHMYCVWEV